MAAPETHLATALFDVQDEALAGLQAHVPVDTGVDLGFPAVMLPSHVWIDGPIEVKRRLIPTGLVQAEETIPLVIRMRSIVAATKYVDARNIARPIVDAILLFVAGWTFTAGTVIRQAAVDENWKFDYCLPTEHEIEIGAEIHVTVTADTR